MSNLLDGVAQKFDMVEADRGNDTEFWSDNIGGIEPPAESSFKEG